ncbi:MAG: caspase family protein [Spirosomataceae bacterium]
MRKLVFVAIIILVVMYVFRNCDSDETTTTDQPTQPTVDYASKTSTDGVKTTYAVIVGVGNYLNSSPQTIADLPLTANDGQLFYQFLTSPVGGSVPANNISFLTGTNASHDNILSEMARLYQNADADDRIIFFFAGHGNTGLFCPYDVVGNDGQHPLLHSEVKAMFKQSKASTKWCIADACHSASIKAPNSTNQGDGSSNTMQAGEGVIVMMAAKPDEYSWDDKRLGNGVFTYFLVKGLNGAADENQDRDISVKELYMYVRRNVKGYVSQNMINPETNQPAVQIPVTFGKFNPDMPISHVY